MIASAFRGSREGQGNLHVRAGLVDVGEEEVGCCVGGEDGGGSAGGGEEEFVVEVVGRLEGGSLLSQ